MFRLKTWSRRRRIALWCVSAAAAVLLLLAFLIFSRPRGFAPEPLSVNDTLTQMTLAAQLYSQISASRSYADTAELTLEPEQLDALLCMILNIAALKDGVSELPFTASYNGRYIEFSASCATGMPWLFGGSLVLSGGGMLECGAGEGETLMVDSLRVGWLPLPGSLGSAAFDLVMARIRERVEYRAFRPALVAVSRLESGAVRVVYKPYFFREYAPDLRGLMSGSWR